jgi:trehalose/maltose transport system substrate-binding protein
LKRILLLAIAAAACGGPARHPVTVTMLDGGWVSSEYSEWGRQALAQFTRETGIVVRRLPAPESANDQLAFEQKLLEAHADTPDVYLIDTIWPGILAEHLIDLNPSLAPEAARHFAVLIANYTVNGRLVAIPYHADIAILFYRTDLLPQYGYRAPPATWEELDRMAAAIQAGERAKGRTGFWGFVWQGAAYEGLTCNALEWQASEGGGRIIESDRTITVNNPLTVRAWERAARRVGSISPPGVVAYLETDARGLWQAGNAAFMRGWPSSYATSAAEGSKIRGQFDVAPLPGGRAGRAATLGESALAISRYSQHAQEATALIRYLTRRDVQRSRAQMTSLSPTIPDLYDDPAVLGANPYFRFLKDVLLRDAVARPSAMTGKKYPAVSEAYVRAVHSVLTGEQEAARAAAGLEAELARITGFRTRTGDDARGGDRRE